MFSSRSIARFIEDRRIDIAHAHLPRDYVAASVAVRSAASVKLVLTRHKAKPLKPFHRFALGNVAAAIGLTDAITEQLRMTFEADKVAMISNGMAIDSKATGHAGNDFRHMHGISASLPLVAVIGELKLSMGQRDLVLAANEVVKQFPDVTFVICGDDHTLDHRFRRELKRLVRVLGLNEKFVWLNSVDDDSALIAAANIIVSASHGETSSRIIIESMAAGKPVIVTATGNPGDLISDDRVLTPVKDPLALADRITGLLADSELLTAIGEQMRSGIRERFDLAKMADATEDLYRKVMGGGL
jgi:glycosyltransferase involved in cell wall biosynthesis